MSAPLLRVENLQIALPARPQPVVTDLGFSVSAGECLALIGASGSGKSLTSAALVYFVSPWWLLLTAFVGLNLLQASVTGFCPAAIVFRKLGIASGCAFK